MFFLQGCQLDAKMAANSNLTLILEHLLQFVTTFITFFTFFLKLSSIKKISLI